MVFFLILAFLASAQSFIGIEMVNTPPTKKWHKWFWRIAFILIALAMIGLGGIQFYQQSKESEENQRTISGLTGEVSALTNRVDSLSQNNAVLTNEVVGLEKRVAQLIDEFSTNPAVEDPIRIAILNDESEKLGVEIAQLQGQHEVFDFSNVTLQTLRIERDSEISNRDAILDAQKQQASIQQKIADIQTQEQTRSNEALAEINAEQAKVQQAKDEQIYLSRQRAFAGKILPIFDYVISKLNSTLVAFSRETGEKIYSNFPGINPTIYSSEMVSNGVLVNGTNFICIGTNSAWHFQISIEKVPATEHSSYSRYGSDANFGPNDPYYIGLQIESEGQSGVSSLFIKSMIPINGNRLVPGLRARQFSLDLKIPDSLKLDGMNMTVMTNNYQPQTDGAIIRLVQAQDLQSPLTLSR